MGNQETKPGPRPTPFLKVEPKTLSSDDGREQRIRKGVPRRLGSMLLSRWIQFKRRERELVEKAKRAVSEGKAPPSILKEITQQLEKDVQKHRVKYHPDLMKEILPPRIIKTPKRLLKVPKLTSTVAMRIQRSFFHRDVEKCSRHRKASNQNGVPLKVLPSARTVAWGENKPTKPLNRTQIDVPHRKNWRRKPKISSGDMSVQSVTSSGIGMSRTASMSSVASSMHRAFYSRRRISRVTDDDALKHKLRTFAAEQNKGVARRPASNARKRVTTATNKSRVRRRLVTAKARSGSGKKDLVHLRSQSGLKKAVVVKEIGSVGRRDSRSSVVDGVPKKDTKDSANIRDRLDLDGGDEKGSERHVLDSSQRKERKGIEKGSERHVLDSSQRKERKGIEKGSERHVLDSSQRKERKGIEKGSERHVLDSSQRKERKGIEKGSEGHVLDSSQRKERKGIEKESGRIVSEVGNEKGSEHRILVSEQRDETKDIEKGSDGGKKETTGNEEGSRHHALDSGQSKETKVGEKAIAFVVLYDDQKGETKGKKIGIGRHVLGGRHKREIIGNGERCERLVLDGGQTKEIKDTEEGSGSHILESVQKKETKSDRKGSGHYGRRVISTKSPRKSALKRTILSAKKPNPIKEKATARRQVGAVAGSEPQKPSRFSSVERQRKKSAARTSNRMLETPSTQSSPVPPVSIIVSKEGSDTEMPPDSNSVNSEDLQWEQGTRSRPQTAQVTVQKSDNLALPKKRRRLPTARGKALTESFRKNLEEDISRSRPSSRPSSGSRAELEPQNYLNSFQQELISALGSSDDGENDNDNDVGNGDENDGEKDNNDENHNDGKNNIDSENENDDKIHNDGENDNDGENYNNGENNNGSENYNGENNNGRENYNGENNNGSEIYNGENNNGSENYNSENHNEEANDDINDGENYNANAIDSNNDDEHYHDGANDHDNDANNEIPGNQHYQEDMAEITDTREFPYEQQMERSYDHTGDVPIDTIDRNGLRDPIDFQLHAQSMNHEIVNLPEMKSSMATQTYAHLRDLDQTVPRHRQMSAQGSRRTTPTARSHSCRKIEQSTEKRQHEQKIIDRNNRRMSSYTKPVLFRSQSQQNLRRMPGQGRRHSLQIGHSGNEPFLSSKQLRRSQSHNSQLDQIHLQHPLNQELSNRPRRSRPEPIYQEIEPYLQQPQPPNIAEIESEIITQQRSPSISHKPNREISSSADHGSSFSQNNSPRHTHIIPKQYPNNRESSMGSSRRPFTSEPRAVFHNREPDHFYESVNYGDPRRFDHAIDQMNNSLASQPLNRQDTQFFGSSMGQRRSANIQSYRQRLHTADPVDNLHRISSRYYPDQQAYPVSRHSYHHSNNRVNNNSVQHFERSNNSFSSDNRNFAGPRMSGDRMNYIRQSARYPNSRSNFISSTVPNQTFSRNHLDSNFTNTSFSLDNRERNRLNSRGNVQMMNNNDIWSSQRFIGVNQSNNFPDGELSFPINIRENNAVDDNSTGRVIQARSRRSSGSRSHRQSSSYLKSARRRRPSARKSAKHSCIVKEPEEKPVKKVKKRKKYVTHSATSTTLDHMDVLNPRDLVSEDHGQGFLGQNVKLLTPTAVLKRFDPLDYNRGETFELFEAKSPRDNSGQYNDAGTSMNNRYDRHLFAYMSPMNNPNAFDDFSHNQRRQSIGLLTTGSTIRVPSEKMHRNDTGTSMEAVDFSHSLNASPRRHFRPVILDPLEPALPRRNFENASAVQRSRRSVAVHSAAPSRSGSQRINGRAILIKKGPRPSAMRSRRIEAVEVANVGRGNDRSKSQPNSSSPSSMDIPRAL